MLCAVLLIAGLRCSGCNWPPSGTMTASRCQRCLSRLVPRSAETPWSARAIWLHGEQHPWTTRCEYKAHSTIDQSHRYGCPQGACREPAGRYDKTTRTAMCFEHKTQYLLIHAPYTLIVVFWHISNIPPPWFRRVKLVVIPPRFIWYKYLWNIAIQPAVGCYNPWANLRCSGCYPLGEKLLWNRSITPSGKSSWTFFPCVKFSNWSFGISTKIWHFVIWTTCIKQSIFFKNLGVNPLCFSGH